MRFLTLLTAGLVALADAYTKPTGPLKGNPIYSPGLNQIVHKGAPFKITWNPTTKGTVTLVLLRGPSTNVKPLYAIAQKIPNNGHHLWTPKMNLEVDSTHYGLQLIVDHNGQYQYSTQFGIGKKKAGAAADEVTELHIANLDDEPTYSTEVVTEYTTYCPSATTVPMGNTTYTVTEPTSLTITNCPCTITHSGTPSAPTYVPPMNTTSHGPYPTYTPPHNATSSHSSSSSSSSKHTTSHTVSKYTTHHVTSHATTPATTKTPAGPTSSSPAPTTTAPSSANAVKLGMGFVAGAAGLAAAMAGL